jgi:hypothetical protein
MHRTLPDRTRSFKASIVSSTNKIGNECSVLMIATNDYQSVFDYRNDVFDRDRCSRY